ncbi:HupE/UreJ family protein, partial [Flavobacteriaceae bacterium]|nr:HupE/UreJ family protein [Flavobacteriaceae bacterium]
FYFSLGFQHVTDFNGLDHFYFIIALALPFGFKQAQKLLWWVTLFTLGHSLSLIGNYYASVAFSAYWIELLIPVTIALSCLPILVQQTPKTNGYASGLTLLFGIIHGFGFGRFFSMMVAPEDAGTSLFFFCTWRRGSSNSDRFVCTTAQFYYRHDNKMVASMANPNWDSHFLVGRDYDS